jgi:hypothetical protein
MSEHIGSLLLAVLFGLPGFLFIQVLAKFCFSSARSRQGLTFQFHASFITSTIILYVFDSDYIHTRLGPFLKYLFSIGINLPVNYVTFLTTSSFNEVLLGYIFQTKNINISASSDLSNVVVTLVFVVTIFAITCSLVLGIFIKTLEWYSKADFSDIFATFFEIICFCLKKTGLLSKKKKTKKQISAKKYHNENILKQQLNNKKNIAPKYKNWIHIFYKKIIEYLPLLFFLLFLITVVLLVIGLMLIPIILALLSELVLLTFHKLLSILRHPCEQIFEPHNFGFRVGVPIIEIRSCDSHINKGRLVSFQPKNSEELLNVTITNVIQYNKAVGSSFFDRTNRQVYEFPNRNSRLTIPSDEIKDINVSYLRLKDFDWHFKIVDVASIKNQLWYLKIILEKHKARFKFSKFKVWIDSQFAPIFFHELLLLLEASYSYFFYGYKLKALTNQLRYYFRPYRLDIKKRYCSLNEEEQREVDRAKSALATTLWRMRKNFPQ